VTGVYPGDDIQIAGDSATAQALKDRVTTVRAMGDRKNIRLPLLKLASLASCAWRSPNGRALH